MGNKNSWANEYDNYFRRSESISLSESDDRVKELSQENVNIKEQVVFKNV